MTDQERVGLTWSDVDDVDEVTTFGPIDDVLEGLASIPGLDDNLAVREAGRERMEKSYRMNLAMVRMAAELTQADLAERLGRTQANVSRTENRKDMLLSTLREYLEAAGVERSRILVTIHGVEHEVELDAFS